jgi:hypothetical protein
MARTEDWSIALCDAGPLIHLDEMECLDLLQDFQEVLIPEQVRDEVARHRPALKTEGLNVRFLPVVIPSDPQFLAIVKAFSLDLGEQAALLLMGRYPGAVLLTPARDSTSVNPSHPLESPAGADRAGGIKSDRKFLIRPVDFPTPRSSLDRRRPERTGWPMRGEMTMPKFLLLLHENPADFQSLSPEDMQKVTERYHAWSAQLLSQGKMVRGQKLFDEGGRHLRRQGSEVTVADGPYTEAKEVVGGLYELETADYEEAATLAQGCPHLDFGWIEIRRIEIG